MILMLFDKASSGGKRYEARQRSFSYGRLQKGLKDQERVEK